MISSVSTAWVRTELVRSSLSVMVFGIMLLHMSTGLVDVCAEDATWSTPTQVAPPTTLWYTIELEEGLDSIYVLSFIYSYGTGGPPYLFKSVDQGSTWSASVLGGLSGEPGMCVYQDGGNDVVLVASGSEVAKSTDGGSSWANLGGLPGYCWRFMAIGTNSSWLGTVPDDDIYVVGSMAGDGYDIGFTKSTDGGMTWSAPVQLTSNSYYYNTMAKITSDGTKLYVVYEIAGNENGVATLVTRSSDNWGLDWSAEKVLVANTGSSYMLRPYSFQNLDGERALLTYVDEPISYDIALTTGNYGYYDFATESYVPVGLVSGLEWMVHEGFAGLVSGSNFTVAWIRALEQNTYPQSEIVFSYSTDSGLGEFVGPELIEADVSIYPNSLNLRSAGKWITAYIELPDAYDVADITLESVMLNGYLSVSGSSDFTDQDKDGVDELKVKFGRAAATVGLEPGMSHMMTVSGSLKNGTEFEGSDVVTVLSSPSSLWSCTLWLGYSAFVADSLTVGVFVAVSVVSVILAMMGPLKRLRPA